MPETVASARGESGNSLLQTTAPARPLVVRGKSACRALSNLIHSLRACTPTSAGPGRCFLARVRSYQSGNPEYGAPEGFTQESLCPPRTPRARGNTPWNSSCSGGSVREGIATLGVAAMLFGSLAAASPHTAGTGTGEVALHWTAPGDDSLIG